MAIAHIHIGSHKTGTTALQRWLKANRRGLLDAGLMVPVAGRRRSNPAHSSLVHTMVQNDGPLADLPEWKALGEEIATATGDVVLSSEVFSERTETPAQAQRIVDFFQGFGFEARFILYLRDPAAFLNSIYCQRVKRFQFQGDFANFLLKLRSEPGLTYPFMIAPFDPVAPLTVRPFPPQNGDLIADFLAAIGHDTLDLSNFPAPARVNERLGPHAILAARLIRNRWDEFPTGTRREAVEPVFRRLSEDHDLNQGAFSGCDDALAAEIRTGQGPRLRRIAKRYFDDTWEASVPAPAFEQNEVPLEGVDDLPPDLRDRIIAVVEGTLSQKKSFPSLIRRFLPKAIRS